MWTVFKKELADKFNSTRFLIIFSLILMVSLIITSMVGISIKEQLSGSVKPKSVFLMLFTASGEFFSLAQFIAFFGPLIGLILGFDTINSERNSGTLVKLLSQPIYRDAVINGKFLAGVVTVAIMFTSLILLISGLGLLTIGVVPGLEEVLRVIVYLIISICYVSFWLGVAILFSIVFRSAATSALAVISLWILFSFFTGFGASLLADVISPVKNPHNIEEVIKNHQTERIISLASPINLYSESTSVILDPYRKTTKSILLVGPMEKISMSRFQNPLPVDQSLLVIAPYLTILWALTFICFGISYGIFMKQEVRSL